MRRRILRLGAGSRTSAPAAAFDPATLSPTLWLDASVAASLFQDDAGSTAVTASGQNVGRLADLSGNNRHYSQTTAAARPVYTESGGLKFIRGSGSGAPNGQSLDGTPAKNIIGLSGAYEVICAARFITQPTPAATQSWYSTAIFSDMWGGYFNLHLFGSSPYQIGHYAYQASDTNARRTYTLGDAVVINARSNGTTIYCSLNGGAETSTASTGPSNRDNVGTYIFGYRAGVAANADFYALLAFARNLSASERANAITWAGAKAGLTL